MRVKDLLADGAGQQRKEIMIARGVEYRGNKVKSKCGGVRVDVIGWYETNRGLDRLSLPTAQLSQMAQVGQEVQLRVIGRVSRYNFC